MVHPPYHPSDSELSVTAFFTVAVLLAILLSSLYFNFRKYRFWKTHPGLETEVPLRRAKRRCALLSVLLAAVLALGLWRFLPLSLDRAADLEPQSLSAAFTLLASGEDPDSPTRLETGPLTAEEAAPLLDTLDRIVLRRDFRNLSPVELPIDARLLGGRQAVLTLTAADGRQQVLTFYGTQLLTLETGSRRLCYRLYEPDYAEQLFFQLSAWQGRPLTVEELDWVNFRFSRPDQPEISNPLCGLAASRYASPEQLELSAFLRHLHGTPADREDLEEIRRLGGDELLEDRKTWMRYSPLTVSSQLELYTGIWLDELETLGSALYSPEKDCYYTWLEDSASPEFHVVEGSLRYDCVTLLSEDAVMTLKPEGSRWLIFSCLPR